MSSPARRSLRAMSETSTPTSQRPTVGRGGERNGALAIEAHGLVKLFGETRAVDGIDLAVPVGTVYGVLGPNGAGKTTTIRVLATLLQPTSGTARVFGHDVVTDADTVRGSVSLTGQFASVDEELSGRENLVLVGRLLGLRSADGRERCGRAARGLRSVRRRRPTGAGVLGWHASPSRHRVEHRGHAGPALPRRADHRARSAQSQPGVGHRASDGRRGHHRAAHHAVPRRGRPARRPDRHHRPRQGDRRGHQRRAQGAGGCRTLCTFGCSTQTSDRRPSGCCPTCSASLSSWSRTRRRCRPASLIPSVSPRVITELANAGVLVGELALGQPSLDEVFLTLTGHPAEDDRRPMRRTQHDRRRHRTSPRRGDAALGGVELGSPGRARRRSPPRSPSRGGRCSRSSTSRCSSST